MKIMEQGFKINYVIFGCIKAVVASACYKNEGYGNSFLGFIKGFLGGDFSGWVSI